MTLIEIMVAITLFGCFSAVAFDSLLSMRRMSATLEITNISGTQGETVLYTLKNNLLSAKKLFSNDAEGASYLQQWKLGAAPAVWGGSLLPTLDATGALSPSDPAFHAGDVGNELLFLREIDPFDGTVPSGATYRVDLYRLERVYLTENQTGYKITDKQGWLNLVILESPPYASFSQLSNLQSRISPGDFQAFVSLLQATTINNEKIQTAWDQNATDASSAFYALNDFLNGPPPYTPETAYPITSSLITYPFGGSFILSDTALFTLAYNNLPDVTDPVPRYGVANGNFPGGLEVIIVGQKSMRRILLRLVPVFQYRHAFLSAESLTVASASEY